MNQTPRVSWPLRHRGRLACTRSLERRTAGCVLFVTCYLLPVGPPVARRAQNVQVCSSFAPDLNWHLVRAPSTGTPRASWRLPTTRSPSLVQSSDTRCATRCTAPRVYYANLGTRHHSDLSAVSVLVSLLVERQRQRGGAEPTNPQSQLSSALPELISAIASLPMCSGFFLAPFAGLSTRYADRCRECRSRTERRN